MATHLPPALAAILACPVCRSRMVEEGDQIRCGADTCRRAFPIVNGCPVLINEDRSVFRISDYTDPGPAAVGWSGKSRLRDRLMKVVPSLTWNRLGRRNLSRFAAAIDERGTHAKVLIVGAGDGGVGVEQLGNATHVDLVKTDVYFAPGVALIADGHDLPFAAEEFDGAVVQAVLEHVADPVRCVREIHRVLKPGGLVYSEVPFLFPVHLGAHDFTRYSIVGHRRLFRDFRQIDAGIGAGPGTALALAIRSLLVSMMPGRIGSALVVLLLPFFIFWLKYLDLLAVGGSASEDHACTVHFLGAKSGVPLSDREVLDSHWTRRRTRT